MTQPKLYCGYCLGDVVWSEEDMQYEHGTNGQRITGISLGDYVSAAHNRKGTRVNSADVCDPGDDEDSVPITDANGYLKCGCHGSQREHSCKDKNVSEFNPADEI